MTRNHFNEISMIVNHPLEFMPEFHGTTLSDIMGSMFVDEPGAIGIPSVRAYNQLNELLYGKDNSVCDDNGDECVQDGDFRNTVKVFATICGSLYRDDNDPDIKVKHHPDVNFVPTKLAVVSDSDGTLHEVNVPFRVETHDVTLSGFYSAIKLLLRTSNVSWSDELFIWDGYAWREVVAVHCFGNGQSWSKPVQSYEDVGFQLVLL